MCSETCYRFCEYTDQEIGLRSSEGRSGQEPMAAEGMAVGVKNGVKRKGKEPTPQDSTVGDQLVDREERR